MRFLKKKKKKKKKLWNSR